jgi:hypothetical protein
MCNHAKFMANNINYTAVGHADINDTKIKPSNLTVLQGLVMYLRLEIPYFYSAFIKVFSSNEKKS